jgi:hypothetical protein
MSPFSTASIAGLAKPDIFIHHCGFMMGSMTSPDREQMGTFIGFGL